MILSDKYKFIFVRPQKIGGTSLESAIYKLDKEFVGRMIDGILNFDEEEI